MVLMLHSQEISVDKILLVKPYLQLGNQGLRVLWHTTDKDQDWTLQVVQRNSHQSGTVKTGNTEGQGYQHRSSPRLHGRAASIGCRDSRAKLNGTRYRIIHKLDNRFQKYNTNLSSKTIEEDVLWQSTFMVC